MVGHGNGLHLGGGYENGLYGTFKMLQIYFSIITCKGHEITFACTVGVVKMMGINLLFSVLPTQDKNECPLICSVKFD